MSSMKRTGKYESNVARFIEDHPGHKIECGPGGFGYSARRKGKGGRPVGERVSALTLDGLAKLLAGQEAAKSG
jgi:hypothetical protein